MFKKYDIESMTEQEIIREAFFALCGYRCPSLTKRKQAEELDRCYEILAAAVHSDRVDSESR